MTHWPVPIFISPPMTEHSYTGKKGVANCYLAHIDSLYINYQIPGQDFNDHENWAILVSDKDSILYKGFEPTPLQNDNFINNSFTYDCDGKLLFTPVYSDTVYQFMSISIVSPKYVIHQKKSIWNLYNQKIPPQEVDKLIKQKDYTRYAGKFLDGGNYASFEIAHKWDKYITPRPYFGIKEPT